ncbi:hypothetical protein [Nocardioides sp.]|uniref:hypothetical protein n=1 Tax=Nocardioides sp. TaxID=35761 RepID=UPI0035673134
MVVPPAPDHDSGLTRSDHPDTTVSDRTSSSTFRVALLGVLVVALLASTGILIWLVAGRTGEADDVQRERETVMTQASQFMLRVNTYGPDLLADDGTMPEYRDLVESIITPKFQTSFADGVTAAEQTVAQAGVGRTAEIFATGVSSIDADSASVLVAGSFVNSYPGKKDERIQDAAAPFRVEVDLVKVDDEWLVDNFTPVTGANR